MSEWGLHSDDYHLDIGPDDVADPQAVFGHDPVTSFTYGTAGLSAADDGDGISAGGMGGDTETAGYDADGDGHTDMLLADTDHDGRTDVAMWDTNHDGLVDRVAYDQDHDGRIDLIYHDDDFDGHVDRIETADGSEELPGYASN
ncbi:hypothetical protein AB0M46_22425 [Dactylosporangium sp. NPDC051485]|uniref:hypothetical protein n=1 Tax=Dactylosporangium sp. NPDC051485 TaxID=3154846 RepID=UPI0034158DF0